MKALAAGLEKVRDAFYDFLELVIGKPWLLAPIGTVLILILQLPLVILAFANGWRGSEEIVWWAHYPSALGLIPAAILFCATGAILVGLLLFTALLFSWLPWPFVLLSDFLYWFVSLLGTGGETGTNIIKI